MPARGKTSLFLQRCKPFIFPTSSSTGAESTFKAHTSVWYRGSAQSSLDTARSCCQYSGSLCGMSLGLISWLDWLIGGLDRFSTLLYLLEQAPHLKPAPVCDTKVRHDPAWIGQGVAANTHNPFAVSGYPVAKRASPSPQRLPKAASSIELLSYPFYKEKN